MAVKAWISRDESARQLLARVTTKLPLLSFSPFHMFPLNAGSVVEIVGPSCSAKTCILMQAVVKCILPKAREGVNYGGSECMAVYLDLDCRFDILRLAKLLSHQIAKFNGAKLVVDRKSDGNLDVHDLYQGEIYGDYGELFADCMKRFLYMRCYNSLEFVATLKTLHFEVQKNKECGIGINLLLIDSIGAFQWLDRVSGPHPTRKVLSHHLMSEVAVHELKKLLHLHPMFILVAKATSLDAHQDGRNARSMPSNDTSEHSNAARCDVPYREYMPSIWQSFVTHRMLVRSAGETMENRQKQNLPVFQSEWLMPPLGVPEKFVVEDEGITMIS